MSRYAVVKFLRQVNMDPLVLAEYKDDPAGYVAAWEASAPVGVVLTQVERDLLSTRDYRGLYSAGAHPYLLWSFTEAVWTPETTRAELVDAYRSATRPLGYPDPRTTPTP